MIVLLIHRILVPALKMDCTPLDGLVKEIFSVFHPGVINQLRFQLPFWILQIADDVSYLTDDFDIKAYLWDGIEELPSLTLRLDVNLSSDNFACECHPSGQLIEQALGELNQWVSYLYCIHGY